MRKINVYVVSSSLEDLKSEAVTLNVKVISAEFRDKDTMTVTLLIPNIECLYYLGVKVGTSMLFNDMKAGLE